jgi:F0F1-type ATP synthase delta subunit
MKSPRTRIASTIADRTLSNGVSKEYSREVAAYLLAEGRVGELDSLLRDVQVDWAASGYVEVLAASAFPLSADTKADITRQVKPLYPNAEQIIITELHDPDVLGGVRLSVANQQLDLSVEAKLNKFKQLVGKE